jgi:hypothetical protein
MRTITHPASTTHSTSVEERLTVVSITDGACFCRFRNRKDVPIWSRRCKISDLGLTTIV